MSCPSFNELLVGTTTGTITVNGVVVDTCAPDDMLILGATAGTDGHGRYRIVTANGSEDGNYYPATTQIVLVRDRINGAALPAGTAKHRTVLAAMLSTAGVSQIVPAPQPVSYKLTGTGAAFKADGSLNASAITPTTNADGSVNSIVLTLINDVAQLNRDLTVTVSPVADTNVIIHPPGIPTVRATTQALTKQIFAPDEVVPTPAPAP